MASTKPLASLLYCWKQDKGKPKVCLTKHVRSYILLQKAKHTSLLQLLHQVIRHLLQLLIHVIAMLPGLSRLSQPKNWDTLRWLKSLLLPESDVQWKRKNLRSCPHELRVTHTGICVYPQEETMPQRTYCLSRQRGTAQKQKIESWITETLRSISRKIFPSLKSRLEFKSEPPAEKLKTLRNL